MNMSHMVFIREKVQKELNIDIESLDFTVLDDGVYTVDLWGKSSLLTEDRDWCDLFKIYEDLRYGPPAGPISCCHIGEVS